MFKKFCIGFLSVTLALLIGVGGFVYAIDPFNVFRADRDMTKIVYQIPYMQNIGISKYTEYDTLITGTSMTQNFRANWFDEKFDCKAIRLSFDGGIVSDFEALLKTAVENNKQLKTVYFGLDNYLITADSKLNDIEERVPEYQISKNPFSKVKYLYNKDVIFNYIPTYFAYKNYEGYNFYEMHAWDNNNPVYSKSKVLKEYDFPEKESLKEKNCFEKNCRDFIDAIGTIVKDNSEIKFVFFAPPYSILYWHNLMQQGTLDATFYALDYVYGTLLKYENVQIFYFQNSFDRIVNLDNYKDSNHYCTDYNRFMLDSFVSGEFEVTAETYKKEFSEMRNFVLRYDFDTLFKEEN